MGWQPSGAFVSVRVNFSSAGRPVQVTFPSGPLVPVTVVPLSPVSVNSAPSRGPPPGPVLTISRLAEPSSVPVLDHLKGADASTVV